MTESLENKRKLTKRRRELLANKPERYCPSCTVLAYPDDVSCLECGAARPERGWPELRDSMDPWLGRLLDSRYLLTKRIGQGASANVYRAESIAISRQFAIKIIHPPKSSQGPSAEQIAARLEREVEALGRLRNPHVVRFYDVIELPLNHIGVVMDFVAGDTLEALVDETGPMTVARASTLLRQIANGVYEAHLVGMTHRDLKPENIMVERLPAGDDFVHVLDFGIVHMEGESGMTQGFIGTPLYASPEQAMGDDVDHRSDIYSLGAISFFMLCGRPPFLGQNVMQVLRQHVEEPPPSIGFMRPDMGVPDELEVLIRRMLAKDPTARPQSLSEVIYQLDRLSYSTSEGKETLPDSSLMEPSTLLASPPTMSAPASASASSTPGRPRSTSQGLAYVDTQASALSEASASAPSPASTDLQHGATLLSSPLPASHPLPSPQNTPEVIAPASSILGRVRRPRSGGDLSTGEFTSAPSLQEHTRPGIPELGEVETGSTIDAHRFVISSDHAFAYLEDEQLHLWRLNPRHHRTFTLRAPDEISALALSEHMLLIGRESGVIEQLDLHSGQTTSLFASVFSDSVTGVATSHDGQTLLAVMASGRVYISGANRPADDWVRVRGGEPARAVTLSARTDLYAVARADGQIEIARLSEPKSIRLRVDASSELNASLAFSEDGYLLATASRDGVALFQVINGKPLVHVSAQPYTLLAFCFSRENTLLGYLYDQERVFVSDLQSMQSASTAR